jgi:hypothetical protein
MIAVSCGTPTPATMRVVQIEPGPMPTLIASAPASISACAPSFGRDVAGDHLHGVGEPLDAVDRFQHARGMAVRGVDHDQIDAGIDQQLGALKAALADRGRGRDAKPPCASLQAKGCATAFLHVLDGDQADAAILIVDDQQLFDAMLVQHPLRLVLADAFAHRDEVFMRHQFEIFWRGSVANRTSRLVRMPTSLPGTPLLPPVTTGMPEKP